MVSLTLIVAATLTNGIGQGARLPWRLPLEMAYFARVTKTAPAEHVNALIMGRKTWESIPKSRRPLTGRVNIVITSNTNYDDMYSSLPTFVKSDLHAALSCVAQNPTAVQIHRCFIIGGASAYRDALTLNPTSPDSPIVDHILLTRILSPAFEGCDVFFPDITGWKQTSHADLEAWTGFDVAQGVQKENGVEYEFQMWVRDA
ncbi:hypothetical protein K439DRAFT_1410575 [Ramaria rubella]|nr:hypothetical protein K439DRAFT_1410575 [Ramaria rubella]